MCASHPQVRESTAPAWNGWGVDLSQLAISARCGSGAISRTGVASAVEMGVRISGRHGVVRPDRVRRPAVCDVQRRLRLLARRGNRLPALGLPRAVGGAERVHDRQAQQDGRAARDFLRRHPRHGIRAVRHDRRRDLENAHRSASARSDHRHAGALRRAAVRAGRVARRAGVGTGGLRVLHVPRLSVGARRGHRSRDLEDVHDSGSAEGRRQELARKKHARVVRCRHLGDADARREAPRSVRHDRQCVLRHAAVRRTP